MTMNTAWYKDGYSILSGPEFFDLELIKNELRKLIFGLLSSHNQT